jgi:hypothetical protein
MTTAHRLILKAVSAVLLAADVADGKVYTSRVRSISAETPHAVVVRLGRSMSSLSSVKGGPTGWMTLVQIESYGRMTNGEPDEASDAIVEAVFAAMAASPTLGNLATAVEPYPDDTLSWDLDVLDEKLACITAKFVVSHTTKGRTLTQ